MAESLGTAVLTLTTESAKFFSGLDKAEKKASLSFRQMATAAAAVGTVVTGIAAGVAKLGESGAGVNDVRDHFAKLTDDIGNTADVLDRLRSATLGNVSDLELMKTVNLGLSQGLKLSADQLGLTGDVAAVLADRIGGDVSTAFETLTEAMATGQDRTLKTIGLNIDAEKATSAYAAAIQKKVADLTEEEKKEAIKNAILQEGQRILAESGKAQEDFGDKVAQSRSKITNFVDGISAWVATNPSIGAWSSVITAASGTVTAMGFALGPVSTGISKLIPLLGLSGGLTGAFAGLSGFITSTIMPLISSALPLALKGLMALFSVPAGLVIAGILAVVAIWKNWDTIGPIVENVYKAVKEFLVDKFVAIVEGVRAALNTITGLWTTLKDGVVGIAQSLYTGVKTWLGDNLAGVLLAVAGPVLGPVMAVITIWKHWDEITLIAQNVYTGVKTWLVDRFQAIVDGVKAKIDAVTGFFTGMYDAVVGHSIVPDLIAGIAAEFGRLDAVMVNPARGAASAISRIFDGMLSEVSGLLGSFAKTASKWADDLIGQLSAKWQGYIGSAASGIGVMASGGSAKQGAMTAVNAGVTAGLGAFATGGTIAGSVALGATTMGIGLAAVGAYKGIKAWMGKREHMAVNDLRDAWFNEHGDLKGVNEAAQGAGDTSLSTTKAIFAAKKKDDFARAVQRWEDLTKPARPLGTGGIVMRPTFSLIGERGPEAVIPLNDRFGKSTINVILDGRVAARAIVPFIPGEVDLMVGRA